MVGTPGSTTPNGNGASASKADYDTLKADLNALREDFMSLATNSGKIASDQMKGITRQASKYADVAGKEIGKYRDVAEDKIRDHPFAAVGIALAAGFLIASLRRR